MSGPTGTWGDDHRRLTANVSVLVGPDNGAYPSGNSLLIEGSSENALIDPSVTVVERGGAPVGVDVVINSHGHEDHVAGNGLFPDAKVRIHQDDLHAVHSLDGLLDIYGFESEVRNEFAATVSEEFYYQARPDAQGFDDGHVFDLGGTDVTAIHLPGHTRGHSGFLVDNVFFLSDIDLTGFGPYYGDAWSDLQQFDDSLVKAREVEADWYVTFHHKGVIEGRQQFLEMIDKFHAVIARRDRDMLVYLAEPRTIEEMAAHRFVYRPHVELTFAHNVERRTADMHVARMVERGQVTEVEPGRFQAV